MIKPAKDIADAILLKSDVETGDIISNLKLQKLLYYVQGFHLAIHNKKIFGEEIEAWQYGPVVPVIYQEFKANGNLGIEPGDDRVQLTKKEQELIDDVYDVYGQFSALKLMKMTYIEPPWKDTPINSIISTDKMEKFFSTLCNMPPRQQ